jgi:16S rRNA (guanine527-N7)-methyltransferase
MNSIRNGWICLKGGDLIEEASATGKDFQLLPLQTWFDEEFFLSKRIVYVKNSK